MKVRRFTEEYINTRLKQLGHTELSIDYPTYVSPKRKCRFIDSDYGEWWTLISSPMKGHRHPKRAANGRAKRRTIPVSEIAKQVREIHGDTLALDEATYTNKKTKARFIDKDHGEYWMNAEKVIACGQQHPTRARTEFGRTRRTPLETIKRRITEVHGDSVTIDESSYTCLINMARFVHVLHGAWEARVENVLKGSSHPLLTADRFKETMRTRYGASHPSQVSEIASRMSSNQGNRVMVRHWKTGKEMVCTASYEYAVVNELNRCRLDYDTQIRFWLGDCAYYCDFYVRDWDLYIETKGYMREVGRVKWERFRVEHPNSELWCFSEVQRFTGKTRYRLTRDFKTAILNRDDKLKQS